MAVSVIARDIRYACVVSESTANPSAGANGRTSATGQTAVTVRDTLVRMHNIDHAAWKRLSVVRKWLLMVRAPVLVMTLSSSLVGILLAVRAGHFDAWLAFALLTGLTLAHATNNLLNDLVDYSRGLDRSNYFRVRYGVHVLEQELVSRRTFLAVMLATGAGALAAAAWLVAEKGGAVLALSAIGAFFVLFYTWPLKYYGLGELSVLLVWGPLMSGGSYYVLAGGIDAEALVLSLIAGVGPTLVILGKHLDKRVQDDSAGVATLPVALGEARTRYLTLALVCIQWVLAAGLLAARPASDWWLLMLLLSIPTARPLMRVLRRNAPGECPSGYSRDVWPLWFSAFAFRYSRDFGAMLVLGLVVAALFN